MKLATTPEEQRQWVRQWRETARDPSRVCGLIEQQAVLAKLQK